MCEYLLTFITAVARNMETNEVRTLNHCKTKCSNPKKYTDSLGFHESPNTNSTEDVSSQRATGRSPTTRK